MRYYLYEKIFDTTYHTFGSIGGASTKRNGVAKATTRVAAAARRNQQNAQADQAKRDSNRQQTELAEQRYPNTQEADSQYPR